MNINELKAIRDLEEQLDVDGVISKGDVLKLEAGLPEPVISNNIPINTFTTTKSKVGLLDAKNIVKSYLESNKDAIEKIDLPVDISKRAYKLFNMLGGVIRLLGTLEGRVAKLNNTTIPSEFKWSVATSSDYDNEGVNDIRCRALVPYLTYAYDDLSKVLTNEAFNPNMMSVIQALDRVRSNIDITTTLTPILNKLVEGDGSYETWVNSNVTLSNHKVSDLDAVFKNIPSVVADMKVVQSSINGIIASLTTYGLDDYYDDSKYTQDHYSGVISKFENNFTSIEYEMLVIRALIAITSNNN